MKTHKYMTMEQHRDACHKLNKTFPNGECEGCMLIEKKPLKGVPGHFKKECNIKKLEENGHDS